MSNQQQWWDIMKKVPAWVSGAISFVTAIIGFVLLLQGNYHLGVTILGILGIAFFLVACIYLYLAKTPPLVEGGKGAYRFEKYRAWALVGIGLIIIIIVMVLIYRPIREFIAIAFGLTTTSTPSVCKPLPYSELPPQSIAIIESLESEGAKSRAPYSTLRYEHMTGLRLASGITIDFKQMKSFELYNPGFTTDFAADVTITLLNCETRVDRIQSESGSYLTAETEFGPLKLQILKVKRVDFQW
jgi:hypothetical protein